MRGDVEPGPGAAQRKEDFTPLLPAGFHPMDWEAMRALCATNGARALMADALGRFIAELRSFGLVGTLWLDGSFVTLKPTPSDIDLLVLPDRECLEAARPHAARLQELFGPERHAAKSLYGCDAYWVDPGNVGRRGYWRDLFGFCHDDITPKGVIELPL